MPYKVTFSANGSRKEIAGLDDVEFVDGTVRCMGLVDGEETLVAAIPLAAVDYVVEESYDADAGGQAPEAPEPDAPETEGPETEAPETEAPKAEAGPVSGEVDGTASIEASPGTAGATATHLVTLEVAEGDEEFEYFRVDYGAEEAMTEISNVSPEDVKRFGVDRDGDGEIEESFLVGDWEVSHGGSGHTLRLRNQDWEGTLNEGDVIILEVDDVKNPEAGETSEAQVILNGHQTSVTSFTVDDGSDAE